MSVTSLPACLPIAEIPGTEDWDPARRRQPTPTGSPLLRTPDAVASAPGEIRRGAPRTLPAGNPPPLAEWASPPDLPTLLGLATRLLRALHTGGGVPAAWLAASVTISSTGEEAQTGSTRPEDTAAAGLPPTLAAAVAGAQQITRRPVRLSTLAQYVRAVERMSASARLPHQIGGQARRSYELYRAALLRVAALGLCAEAARWRSHQDGSSGVADLDNPNRLLPLLVHLAAAIRLCRALPWSAVRGGEIAPWGDALSDPLPSRDAAARPRQRRASRSKRGGLGRLPADWREQMLAAWPPGSHWAALPLRALALLGVRPVELTGEGIILHCTADHLLVATVRCAKTRAGSPARTRSITLDPARSHGSAWELVEALIAQPGGEGRLVIRIDCPRRLSDAVRALGRRLFGRTPYQVAPYSLRHQFAADAKAVAAWTTADGSGAASGREGHGRKGQQVGGLPPLARSSDECDGTTATESQRHPQLSGPRTAVAILLGHQSLRSQSSYGTRGQTRGALVHLVSLAPERLVTPTASATRLSTSPIADVRRRHLFPQS